MTNPGTEPEIKTLHFRARLYLSPAHEVGKNRAESTKAPFPRRHSQIKLLFIKQSYKNGAFTFIWCASIRGIARLRRVKTAVVCLVCRTANVHLQRWQTLSICFFSKRKEAARRCKRLPCSYFKYQVMEKGVLKKQKKNMYI